MSLQHRGAHPDRPLTPSVRAGDWLFVSGQASTDPDDGSLLPGSFAQEMHRAVDNLFRVLEDAGAGVEQIAKVTAFVNQEGHLPEYNRIYLERFPHPRPARTTFVSPLEIVKVELECQAYLGA